MPLLTLTAAGTAQPLVTGVNVASNPTARFCSRVHVKNEGPGTSYIGVQKPLGTSSSVSASAYDLSMLPGESQTIGWGDGVYVDLGATYWDSDTSSNKITFLPETY